MDLSQLQQSFKDSVSKSISISPEGTNRYFISTPFHFDDGDHFVIILHNDGNGNLYLTDEGHTYMHLSYHTDMQLLKEGTRNKMITSALDKYTIKEEDGQLILPISTISEAGNALYDYIQCLVQITDTSYLSREIVASTFMEDFKRFLSQTISDERIVFDYRDKDHDPEGRYLVDCRVNGMPRPLHIYGIKNDDQCRDATIGILQFKSWNIDFRTLAVFENQEDINRKVLARFTDVSDRQFSSFEPNKDNIEHHITELLVA